jgi:uncharacterized protein with HEPN domain
MSKDNAYLADILDSARIIRQHLAGMNREQFLADQRTQDAVVRRFEIIGEAARHLSPAALKALPDVPWNLMVGMRKLLITTTMTLTRSACGRTARTICRR